MTDWKENERKQIINALNRIADNLGRIAKGVKRMNVEYTSPIGWKGILNEEGVTVWDEYGNRKMHSRYPDGDTIEWLKRLVDELPDVIRELVREQCIADAEE